VFLFIGLLLQVLNNRPSKNLQWQRSAAVKPLSLWTSIHLTIISPIQLYKLSYHLRIYNRKDSQIQIGSKEQRLNFIELVDCTLGLFFLLQIFSLLGIKRMLRGIEYRDLVKSCDKGLGGRESGVHKDCAFFVQIYLLLRGSFFVFKTPLPAIKMYNLMIERQGLFSLVSSKEM